MLSPARSLTLSVEKGRELPRVEGLEAFYKIGGRLRAGELVMIAGRSGTMKSTLAMWWVWSMNVPCLYFSADMNATTASKKLASMATGDNLERIEHEMDGGNTKRYLDALKGSRLSFAYGSPITWKAVDEELEAYVELWDAYPEIIVFDNVMDFHGAESDYVEQMAVMSSCTEMARETGATVLVLHHASDKTFNAREDPWHPPSRDQLKNGLAEKPEMVLSVALDPSSHVFRIAVLKQRSGRSDPTANLNAALRCYPETSSFGKL